MPTCLVWILATLLHTGAAVSDTLDLTLLPESKFGDVGGRCLDGTMAGYYYGAPSSGTSSLWVVSMAGGGACMDEQSCKDRAKGHLGSSKFLKSTFPTKTSRESVPWLSSDPAFNPDFHNAHHVHIPYCTGDAHSGQVVKPTSKQWGLFFSGHLNLKSILDNLMSTIPAMHQMDRILLSGGSAGGLGTFVNCDWLQSYLHGEGLSTKVSCAPDAGWFFPGDTDDHTDPDERPSDWPHWSQGQPSPPSTASPTEIWQGYLPPECTSSRPKETQFHCGTVHVSYPHIKAPVYVMENQYDTNQLHAQLGLPQQESGTRLGHEYITYFGRSMRNSTNQVVKHPLGKVGDGLFLPSCYAHGVGLQQTKLSGFTAQDGLGDWFWGRGKVPRLLVDDCTMVGPGLPCNPTCPSAPGASPSPGSDMAPGIAPHNCAATLRSHCGSTIGKLQQCKRCLSSKRQEMNQASCTVEEVVALCQGSLLV